MYSSNRRRDDRRKQNLTGVSYVSFTDAFLRKTEIINVALP